MANNHSDKTKDHLRTLSEAYDKTVDDYKKGIEEEDLLPDEFKNSKRYKRFKDLINSNPDPSGSDDSQIFNYLNPKVGMKFLDVGSCANLITGKLHEWPSEYYGIDISPKLIKASLDFVKRNNLKIGGLYVAEAAKMPFEDNSFDISAIIGVFEYFDINYIRKALEELHRVMKPEGKTVIDIPNFSNPDCKIMIELERHLGRTSKNTLSNEEFETELKKLFSIEKIDTQIMISYFAKSKK